MDICSFCNKLKIGAASCSEYIIIVDGKRYLPVKFQGNGGDGQLKGEQSQRCPGCNVLPNGFHHVGCGKEICPKCGGRWIMCRCSGIKKKRQDVGPKVLPFPGTIKA